MSAMIGTELNLALKDLFDKRISTAVIATIDQNLFPHTAPFNFILAPDVKHLRIAIFRDHQTYENIIANHYVAVEVVDEGDIAVCIKGIAKVIRPNMERDYNMAIIEVEISEIKKDNSQYHFVTQGIRIRHKNEMNLLAARRIFQELSQTDEIPIENEVQK